MLARMEEYIIYINTVFTDGTTNPRVTQEPDNPLKWIRNTVPWKPDNPIKGIRNIAPNGTRNQWPRWFTV